MGASKKIVEEFGGQVPRTMEQLLTLPGRRAKNGERRPGHGVRHRRRSGRGYACHPAVPPPRPFAQYRSQENRTGFDARDPARQMDFVFPPIDLARPQSLPGAQSPDAPNATSNLSATQKTRQSEGFPFRVITVSLFVDAVGPRSIYLPNAANVRERLAAEHISGILHPKYQVHGFSVHLTARKVSAVDPTGQIDFGGGEYIAAGRMEIAPTT